MFIVILLLVIIVWLLISVGLFMFEIKFAEGVSAILIVLILYIALYTPALLSHKKSICNIVSESTEIPQKIIRSSDNSYGVQSKDYTLKTYKLRLIKEGNSYIETKKYKQKNKFLDWIVFDFEESILYLNVNDEVELTF